MTTPNARVLVTGGHGFLGSHLVDLLLARGFAVRCLLRRGRSEALLGGRPVEVVRGDLRSDEGLADAVRDMDLVFHVAGLVAARTPADFHAVNAAGTGRLAAAVLGHSPTCRRFVLVSSQAAAGPSLDGRPVTEDLPPNPLSHYGRSKLEAELRLAALPIPWTVIRPPAIYGPRDLALLPFFAMAARGLAPGLEGPGRRFNLLHARDVARGILLAVEAEGARGRVYFLSDGEGYGYPDVACAMGSAFGRRTRRVPVPDKASELKARLWICSAGRAEHDLGWQPLVPLDEGIRETADWYVQEGLLRRR
jgi:nucleoside-diphosphate-sugar epimerase